MKTEIITPAGTQTLHEWRSKSRDADARLQEMYRLIGCETVEHVSLRGGGHMWFDEDSKGRNLALNSEATLLLLEAGGAPTDYVAGTVIVETPERKTKS